MLQVVPREVYCGYQEKFLHWRVVKHWNKLSREVVESLERCRCGELGSDYLTVGLNELKGLLQLKWFYDTCFSCWYKTTCAMMTGRLSLENKNHQYSFSDNFPVAKLSSFSLCCTFPLVLWILPLLLESGMYSRGKTESFSTFPSSHFGSLNFFHSAENRV